MRWEHSTSFILEFQYRSLPAKSRSAVSRMRSVVSNEYTDLRCRAIRIGSEIGWYRD